MKESSIHIWFRNQMKFKFGERMMYIKPPGGMYASRRGISDFIFCIDGIYVAVEVKTETGKITPLQQNFIDEVVSTGGVGLFLIGKDEQIFEDIERSLILVKAKIIKDGVKWS